MSEEAPKSDAQPQPDAAAKRVFRIYEDDLAELERILPDICEFMYTEMTNRQRVQFRRLREILADVRWSYGPPLKATVV